MYQVQERLIALDTERKQVQLDAYRAHEVARELLAHTPNQPE